MSCVYIQPYNPNSKCPKCGSEDITLQFHKGTHTHYACYVDIYAKRWNGLCCVLEHLCRTCRNCSFGWPEGTLDGETNRQITEAHRRQSS